MCPYAVMYKTYAMVRRSVYTRGTAGLVTHTRAHEQHTCTHAGTRLCLFACGTCRMCVCAQNVHTPTRASNVFARTRKLRSRARTHEHTRTHPNTHEHTQTHSNTLKHTQHRARRANSAATWPPYPAFPAYSGSQIPAFPAYPDSQTPAFPAYTDFQKETNPPSSSPLRPPRPPRPLLASHTVIDVASSPPACPVCVCMCVYVCVCKTMYTHSD